MCKKIKKIKKHKNKVQNMKRDKIIVIKVYGSDLEEYKKTELSHYNIYKLGLNTFKNIKKENEYLKEMDRKLEMLERIFSIFQKRMIEKEIEKKEINSP